MRTFIIALLLISSWGCGIAAEPTGSAAQQAVAAADDTEPNPRFQRVLTKLELGGTSFFYIDTAGAVDSLFAFAEPISAISPQVGAIVKMVESGVRALGLDAITDYGHSAIKLKSGVTRQKTYLGLKERRGLFALAGSEPHSLEGLKFVPETASAAWCGSFEFGKILPLLRDVARAAAGASGTGMLDSAVQNAGKEMGIDLKAVAEAMGDEYCAYTVLAEGNAGGSEAAEEPHLLFVGRVKVTSDAASSSVVALLSRSLDITQMESQEVDGEGDLWRLSAKAAGEDEDGTATASRKKAAAKSGKTAAAAAEDTAPLFLKSVRGWLVLSNNLEELQRSEAAAKGGKNLLQAAEFKKMAGSMPSEVSAVSFISERYTTYYGNTLRRTMEQMSAGVSGDEKSQVQHILQAVNKAVSQSALLQPSVSWRVNDAQGIQWVQIGGVSTSPAAMMGVAGVGIGVAVAVPAFLRARENSRGRACQENLAKIDGAKEQYALEHNLKTGAKVTMKDLVGTYLKRTPTCPAGGTYTLNAVGENPTCSYEGPEWAEKHKLP
jgi:hypothetical protein